MKPVDPSQLLAQAAPAGTLTARLLPAIGWLRGVVARRRKLLLALASVLFVGGFAWALASANIAFASIAWSWLAGALLLGFVGVVLNGWELSVAARALGRQFPAGEAIHLSSVGILSNLLPVPASAFVRGSALLARGATLVESGRILLLVGLLRLTTAGSVTGLALLAGPIGLPIVAVGVVASALLLALIARQGGFRPALVLLALRIGMIAIVALQLLFCFRALGEPAGPIDAALYAVAPVVGSAIGIVPGGLGVSEAIGAALAVLASASPAVAFAALGLSRIVGYACALVTVLAFQVGRASGDTASES